MNFSDDELRDLAALLDEVIPPSADGRMPGAGELGLGERIAREMAANGVMLDTVRSGIANLDRVARGEHGSPFGELPSDDRKRVLAQVAEAEPTLVPTLAFPTYIAYYEHPRVLSALGLEPRPPHPDGYELEPFDTKLLEGVRQRAHSYREC